MGASAAGLARSYERGAVAGERPGPQRFDQLRELLRSRPPLAREAIQKGTRVLISLWDSLMFGRVPKNA